MAAKTGVLIVAYLITVLSADYRRQTATPPLGVIIFKFTDSLLQLRKQRWMNYTFSGGKYEYN